MHIEALREYCLGKPGVTEGFPFGEDTLVFKVGGKLFALASLAEPDSVNLKCSPEEAIELREAYPDAILPGYHMSKQHWNTVSLVHGLPTALIVRLIDTSYALVRAGLPKAVREVLDAEAPL